MSALQILQSVGDLSLTVAVLSLLASVLRLRQRVAALEDQQRAPRAGSPPRGVR